MAIRHRIDLWGSREVSKVDRRNNLLRHVRMYLGIPKYIYINVDRISIFTNNFLSNSIKLKHISTCKDLETITIEKKTFAVRPP